MVSYPDSQSWIAGSSGIHHYHGRLEEWISLMRDWSQGLNLPKGRVRVIQWLALNEQGKIIGMINLRPQLNDYLRHSGGHIGYVVHPEFRRQGLATWMLRQACQEAKKQGLDKVLLTCAEDNEASARTIEGAGGCYQDQVLEKGVWVKRYWLDLT